MLAHQHATLWETMILIHCSGFGRFSDLHLMLSFISFCFVFLLLDENMPHQSLFIGMPSKYFLLAAFSLVYYHNNNNQKYYHIHYSYYRMKTYFAFISVDAGIQL